MLVRATLALLSASLLLACTRGVDGTSPPHVKVGLSGPEQYFRSAALARGEEEQGRGVASERLRVSTQLSVLIPDAMARFDGDSSGWNVTALVMRSASGLTRDCVRVREGRISGSDAECVADLVAAVVHASDTPYGPGDGRASARLPGGTFRWNCRWMRIASSDGSEELAESGDCLWLFRHGFAGAERELSLLALSDALSRVVARVGESGARPAGIPTQWLRSELRYVMERIEVGPELTANERIVAFVEVLHASGLRGAELETARDVVSRGRGLPRSSRERIRRGLTTAVANGSVVLE